MRSNENPGNPKFDLFHKVKMVRKLGISTKRDQNQIYSEGGQNTSTCKFKAIPPCVLKEMTKNCKFGLFH